MVDELVEKLEELIEVKCPDFTKTVHIVDTVKKFWDFHAHACKFDMLAVDSETEGKIGRKYFEEALLWENTSFNAARRFAKIENIYNRSYKGKSAIKSAKGIVLQWRSDTEIYKTGKGELKERVVPLRNGAKQSVVRMQNKYEKAIKHINKLRLLAQKDKGGLNFWENELALVQVGTYDEENKHFDCFLIRPGVIHAATFERLLNTRATILLHHCQFDWKQFKKHLNIHLDCKNLYDTKIAEFIIKNGREKQTSMGAVVKRRFGYEANKSTALRVNHWLGDLDEDMTEYAAMDVVWPFFMHFAQLEELDEKLVGALEREHRVVPYTAMMEMEGIGVDLQQTNKLLEEKIPSRQSLVEKCSSLLNIDPTLSIEEKKKRLDSKPQLIAALNKLDWNLGLESTESDVLEKIVKGGDGDAEVCQAILDYRNVDTIISRYLLSFINRAVPIADPIRGITRYRIYGELKQSDTETGRFASENPNLQNFPKTYEFRSLVTARPGYRIIQGDLASIEPRILAHVTQDPTLLRAFKFGFDPYKLIGSILLGKKYEEVTKSERKKIKAVVLGLCYGKTEFGLARDLECSEDEARTLIREVFSILICVKRWKQDTIKQAYLTGYVETLGGRRRYLDNLFSDSWKARKHAENQAINTPIQGTAADMMKESIIIIGEQCARFEGIPKLLVTVHDECLLEVPDDELWINRGKQIVLYGLVTGSKKFVDTVPIKVGSEPEFEPSVVYNWGQCMEEAA